MLSPYIHAHERTMAVNHFEQKGFVTNPPTRGYREYRLQLPCTSPHTYHHWNGHASTKAHRYIARTSNSITRGPSRKAYKSDTVMHTPVLRDERAAVALRT